jgi:rhamnulokinase
VLAGPVEATALGNVLMQAVASADISSVHDARAIVRESFSVEEYLPREKGAWDEAYAMFAKLQC